MKYQSTERNKLALLLITRRKHPYTKVFITTIHAGSTTPHLTSGNVVQREMSSSMYFKI